MTTYIDIEFTPKAEQLLIGDTGIHRYEFGPGEAPNVGDHIVLLGHPGNERRSFVCTKRLWDFSQTGERRLKLTLDFE